jgi:hypothetical protein
MDYPTEGDRHLRRNFVLKNEEILRAGQRKMRDHRFLPLNFSGCGFFLAGCCSLAASSCFTSLIWSSICRTLPGPASRLPPEAVFECIVADLEILSYFPVGVAGHDGWNDLYLPGRQPELLSPRLVASGTEENFVKGRVLWQPDLV